MDSPWPVLRIYQANHADRAGDEAIDLDGEAGSKVLVLRQGWEVELHPLSNGEFSFLSALAENASLEPALQCASQADQSFDPTAVLLRGIQSGFFSHLIIERGSPS